MANLFLIKKEVEATLHQKLDQQENFEELIV